MPETLRPVPGRFVHGRLDRPNHGALVVFPAFLLGQERGKEWKLAPPRSTNPPLPVCYPSLDLLPFYSSLSLVRSPTGRPAWLFWGVFAASPIVLTAPSRTSVCRSNLTRSCGRRLRHWPNSTPPTCGRATFLASKVPSSLLPLPPVSRRPRFQAPAGNHSDLAPSRACRLCKLRLLHRRSPTNGARSPRVVPSERLPRPSPLLRPPWRRRPCRSCGLAGTCWKRPD